MTRKKISKAEVKRIVQKILKIQAKLDQVKPLYQELDDLTVRLADANVKEVKEGDVVIHIVDNFATKNTAFKATGVKRFEAKIKAAS